ncbi:YhgE/Pip family protein [Gorillibacterium massiliense]|uniref:YhgE/Pip family protein n=1 Tax=Gorillibacterium massiliense TaxID=1280390 RepID=UPI0004BCFDEB|nr:YhgE/Pip domain-containing protein [Gorillibacterium massiliense]
MKLFQVFTGEIRQFVKKPILIVTFVAVACIPLLYSGFLIRGNWNPYGNLQNLPIAVVNLDEGADIAGVSRNVGDEFLAELRKNDTFAWDFVSADEAAQGMRSNHYYSTITIPPDFSQHAASLTGNTPQQAELIFESNSYYNLIAGQISENATKELRTKLSESLTESYSRSILARFETVAAGFGDAAKGSADLHAGTESLNAGIIKLKTGTEGLAAGTQKLSASVGALYTGADKVQAGSSELSKGAADLAKGAADLQSAAVKLQDGASQATAGTASLQTGMQTSKAGADKLAAGAKSAATGSDQLTSGLSSSAAASKQLAAGADQVAAGLEQLAAAQPDLAKDATVQKLLAASKSVAQGAKDLQTGQAKLLAGSQNVTKGLGTLATGAEQLSAGQQKLLAGATDLQKGQTQLLDGLKTYNSKFPALVTGSRKLETGAAQINTGAGQLASGVGQFATGLNDAATGAKQLDSGAAELVTGAGQLANGSGQLADKLNDAASKTAAVKADDSIIQMLANPVKISENDDRKVKYYGVGIAPYFISMALFAGALVFTTVYAARSTTQAGANTLSLMVGKLLVFGVMSVIQSLVICTVLLLFLGFEVVSVPRFYLFTVLTGLTFMMLIQMLVTWLDLPGRFVVLILMILQLASSAGTFPLELLPGWAKAIHPWLPMTYSIIGFRDVISSGDFTAMWHQAGYLCIYLVFSVALTCGFFLYRMKYSGKERVFPETI